MSNLKVKQISNLGGEPGSYITFDGNANRWQKIRHVMEFSDIDLVNGVLTVGHNLDRKYVVVTIYDEEDCQVIPDQVKVFDGFVEVTLSSFDVLDWTILIS